jgi:hypothetical protein
LLHQASLKDVIVDDELKPSQMSLPAHMTSFSGLLNSIEPPYFTEAMKDLEKAPADIVLLTG